MEVNTTKELEGAIVYIQFILAFSKKKKEKKKNSMPDLTAHEKAGEFL